LSKSSTRRSEREGETIDKESATYIASTVIELPNLRSQLAFDSIPMLHPKHESEQDCDGEEVEEPPSAFAFSELTFAEALLLGFEFQLEARFYDNPIFKSRRGTEWALLVAQ
jgi:hypothetical protein